jgi:hypothetical protein
MTKEKKADYMMENLRRIAYEQQWIQQYRPPKNVSSWNNGTLLGQETTQNDLDEEWKRLENEFEPAKNTL